MTYKLSILIINEEQGKHIVILRRIIHMLSHFVQALICKFYYNKTQNYDETFDSGNKILVRIAF